MQVVVNKEVVVNRPEKVTYPIIDPDLARENVVNLTRLDAVTDGVELKNLALLQSLEKVIVLEHGTPAGDMLFVFAADGVFRSKLTTEYRLRYNEFAIDVVGRVYFKWYRGMPRTLKYNVGFDKLRMKLGDNYIPLDMNELPETLVKLLTGTEITVEYNEFGRLAIKLTYGELEADEHEQLVSYLTEQRKRPFAERIVSTRTTVQDINPYSVETE